MAKIQLSTVLDDVMEHEDEYIVTGEEIKKALNTVLAQQKPHPAVTLSILASLSAGYIRQLQQVYTAAGTNEVVEEAFQKLLTAQLTALDMKDVRGEVTKIKNRDLN